MTTVRPLQSHALRNKFVISITEFTNSLLPTEVEVEHVEGLMINVTMNAFTIKAITNAPALFEHLKAAAQNNWQSILEQQKETVCSP